MTLQERLWAKVDIGGLDECWLWTAYLNSGHAHIAIEDRRKVYAHRLVYEWEFGPIPDGKDIHHTCENGACMNPRHLEALTRREHRARHRLKRCKRGHNDWATLRSGKRQCRACDRLRHRQLYGWWAEEKKEVARDYQRRYRQRQLQELPS